MLDENKTIISFEKNKEGEQTNSLFLFDKVINRDSITSNNVVDMFLPKNASQSMIINKKPQGVESIINKKFKNGVYSTGTNFDGAIADFLVKYDSLPKNVDLVNHVKESNRAKFKNI